MKIIKGIGLFVLLFSLFGVVGHAEGTEDYFGDISEIAPEGSFEFDDAEELMDAVGVKAVLSGLLEAVCGQRGEIASFFLMLLGLSALLVVSETASELSKPGFTRGTRVCISLVTSIMIFSRMSRSVLAVGASIKQLNSFFSSTIPILSGILAAGGSLKSAGTQGFNMTVTLSVLGNLAVNFLIPAVFCMFALSLLSGLGESPSASVAKGIKGFFTWGLGIVSTVVIGAFSLQSIVSSASDSAYLRAAKYAASGLIPVVGSTVSGALSSLTGGLGYIKSTVGVGCVFVIIGMVLSPLVTLLLYRMSFSICIFFLDFVGCSGGVQIYSAFRSAHDAMIAVYSLISIVYIFEIVVFAVGGGAVLG